MSMKFGKKIKSEAISAWKLHYIDYGHLKRRLKQLLTEEPNEKARDALFILDVDKQRSQTRTFYQLKEDQAHKNLEALLHSRGHVHNNSSQAKYIIIVDSLVISFHTLQDELQDLKRFAELNAIGFSKILKKYDKWAHTNIKEKYIKDKLDDEPFYKQNRLNQMVSVTEKQLLELETLKMTSGKMVLTSSKEEEKLFVTLNMNDLENFKTTVKEIRSKGIVTCELQETLDRLLLKTAASGNKEFLNCLLENDSVIIPDFQTTDEFGRNILQVAHKDCFETICNMAKSICTPSGTSLDILAQRSDNNGRPPLHCLAQNGASDEINTLLSKVSPDVKPKIVNAIDSHNSTPLLVSSHRGHVGSLSMLLQHGATADARDTDLNTALHLIVASSACTREAIVDLVTNGCPVNGQNAKQQTPLHIAIASSNTTAVSWLLSCGSSPFIVDSEGSTSLHLASQSSNLFLVKSIIESIPTDKIKQFCDQPNLDGCTAIMLAAQEDSYEISHYLISIGASLEITDNDGWTAEAYAAYVGDLYLADTLSANLKPEAIIALLSSSQQSVSSQSQPQSLAPINVSPSTSQPASPASNSPKIANLLSRVEFVVKAKTSPSEYVAIIGDRKVLGSWDPFQALPLSRQPDQSSTDESTWKGHVYLPTKVPTKYRYIIMEGSQIQKWESLPKNRLVQPTNKAMITDDGTFGIDIKFHSNEEYVEEGWLISQSQIRIRFKPNGGLTLYDHPKLPTTKVSISTRDPVNTYHQVFFPLSPEDEEKDYIIQAAFQADKIPQVQFDIYNKSGYVLIGRAVVHSTSFKSLRGFITTPIMNTTLSIVGEISFRFVIVTPFSHPKMTMALEKTFWRATALIGHRGGGADAYSKIGNYHRSHIQENTLLSFVTASSLGAEYVEFDVQLTKDKVPIIYHNFIIPDPESSSGVEFPIGSITWQQLKRLRAKKQIILPKHEKQKRTNSLENVYRSHEAPELGSNNNSNGHAGGGGTNFIEDKYTTLEECFKNVPKTTGFNIEMKYPMDENVVRFGLDGIVERNEYVDRVLNVVFACAEDRKIMFSSFDPDICTLISLKQPKYPVFFLTHSGNPNNYADPRCNSIQQAIRFAKSSKIMGIVCESTPLIKNPQLIAIIKASGLVLATYGVGNNKAEYANLQEQMGVDAIIVDHVAYVSNSLRGKPK